MHGILASAGCSKGYLDHADMCIRNVLNNVHQTFEIATAHSITLDIWEAWGRDTHLMGKLSTQISAYSAVVNGYLSAYRERLTPPEHLRLDRFLLPPMPKQFLHKYVPLAVTRDRQRRTRKAKTDVISECAIAILALMLARYPSMERFARWYREQLARIEAGELAVPARLVYEDHEMDLPRQPGPDAMSVEDLRWRLNPVRLDLTIWRGYEFSAQRIEEWFQGASPGTLRWKQAIKGRQVLRAKLREGRPSVGMYFIQVHPGNATPWFVRPMEAWYRRLAVGERRIRRSRGAQADGRNGIPHSGIGTPERALAIYLAQLKHFDQQHQRRQIDGFFFEPEATYRGVLFGTALVTLMLTADARVHELLQISVDRFVKPARIYIVKNPDGTPKRDPRTNRIVEDVMLEQLLLPKGRTSDELRLKYDVSAARKHLREMTRLLKNTHQGHVPVVSYTRSHRKAEHLGTERYLFQWNSRHLSYQVVNRLIRLVLDGVVLVDRSGERIDVTSHLLRHAAATVQRQDYGVPLNILAEAMGHTLTRSNEAPEATRYYSEMTEDQKAEIRHEAIFAIMDDARSALRVIDPADEARRIEKLMLDADEQTREMLERYGGLHPVTFGHCGYPGLCVRGTRRQYCIGCPFLVRRPEYIDRVEFFLQSYTEAAEAFDRMGDLAGARERRRQITELQRLRQEMRLLAEAECQGTWTPSWKQLPPSSET